MKAEIKFGKVNFKFGDKILNHYAGENNPHRIGIVYLCTSSLVKCTNMYGGYWEFSNDKDLKLEKIGSILESPATPSVGREELIKLLQEAKKGCLITSGLTGNIYWKFDNDSETKLANDFLASHPESKPVEVTDEMIEKQANLHFKENTSDNAIWKGAAKWMRSQLTGNKEDK